MQNIKIIGLFCLFEPFLENSCAQFLAGSRPCALIVQSTLLVCGMPHACYSMQQQPFCPSHNRCTVHPVRVGHTPWPSGLPSEVQPETLAGVICRQGCCWYPCARAKCTDFPRGALALYVCCPTAAILCGVRSGCQTAYGAGGAGLQSAARRALKPVLRSAFQAALKTGVNGHLRAATAARGARIGGLCFTGPSPCISESPEPPQHPSSGEYWRAGGRLKGRFCFL